MATAGQWLVFLTLCSLLGATGQAARSIVGLKKARDEAASTGTDFKSTFETSTLVISLIIGGVAGVIAGLALGIKTDIDTQFALGIMASGYAGADFIEGFMSREASKFAPAAPKPAATADAGGETVPVG